MNVYFWNWENQTIGNKNLGREKIWEIYKIFQIWIYKKIMKDSLF